MPEEVEPVKEAGHIEVPKLWLMYTNAEPNPERLKRTSDDMVQHTQGLGNDGKDWPLLN